MPEILTTKYLIAIKSYFKGLLLHEDRIFQPRLSTDNISCMVGVARLLLWGEEYLFTHYQYCQAIFRFWQNLKMSWEYPGTIAKPFGNSEANIIASLASCNEMCFFSYS